MKKIITIVVLLAVVGGGAFYGGMKYAQGQAPARRFGQGQGGAGGAGGRGNRAGFSTGEIISKDDKSITIKLSDGGSKIIFVSGTTHVGKNVDGTLADLTTGTKVVVNGSDNADGSITAQSVQIGGLTMFGRQSPSPSPSN